MRPLLLCGLIALAGCGGWTASHRSVTSEAEVLDSERPESGLNVFVNLERRRRATPARIRSDSALVRLTARHYLGSCDGCSATVLVTTVDGERLASLELGPGETQTAEFELFDLLEDCTARFGCQRSDRVLVALDGEALVDLWATAEITVDGSGARGDELVGVPMMQWVR